MAEPAPFPRQWFLWIDPGAWWSLLDRRQDLAAIPLLADWADLDRPFVVRRPVCDDSGSGVPLGLPLPPNVGKLRLAIQLPAEAVLRASPPPLLAEAAAAAPGPWREAILALLTAASDTRCFGSLAWSYLTGLSYMSATSDLDLLWAVRTAQAAQTLANGVADVARWAPMRIDGELSTPSGHAVQWREWLSDSDELMAKHGGGVQLVARDRLFA